MDTSARLAASVAARKMCIRDRIDSVDQFSVQTQAAPESGRNPGGTVDLALKSGGNDIHGTGYYYIRK